MCAPKDGKVPVAEIYSKALALFQDKERWAKGYYNYDKEGNRCNWADGHSFCALGALVFFGGGHSHEAQCCLQRISEHLYGECIQLINDNDPQGYEKVIKALELGIELWKGREPVEEELRASVPQLLQVRQALLLSGLPETKENLTLAHQGYRELADLLDQTFGGGNG